jgi:hypothetical protein
MARLMSFTLAVVAAVAIGSAGAQTNGKAGSRLRLLTGVVTAVSTSSLTIGRGQHEMVVDVGSSTRFIGKQKNAAPRDLVLGNAGSPISSKPAIG